MAKTTSTYSYYSKNTNAMMLGMIAAFAVITNQILSVDAIRCHQCNSHLDEDCIKLRLSTPHAPLDEHYLKECADYNGEPATFCRKTSIAIESTGENRIIRACGWLDEAVEQPQALCFNADNDGYSQMICTCIDDGCNSAPSSLMGKSAFMVYALTGCTVLIANLLRRCA